MATKKKDLKTINPVARNLRVSRKFSLRVVESKKTYNRQKNKAIKNHAE